MPANDNKKNFGFVVFDNPEVASKVVSMEHIMYNNTRLNVEPKTQRGYSGSNNSQRNNYSSRGGGGMNRGNRGPYRGSGNNQRRGGGGGGQYQNNSPSLTGGDENYKTQPQQ
jgi:hypothetical protein